MGNFESFLLNSVEGTESRERISFYGRGEGFIRIVINYVWGILGDSRRNERFSKISVDCKRLQGFLRFLIAFLKIHSSPWRRFKIGADVYVILLYRHLLRPYTFFEVEIVTLSGFLKFWKRMCWRGDFVNHWKEFSITFPHEEKENERKSMESRNWSNVSNEFQFALNCRAFIFLASCYRTNLEISLTIIMKHLNV